MKIENTGACMLTIDGVRIKPLEVVDIDLKKLSGKKKAVVDHWFEKGWLTKASAKKKPEPKPEPEQPESAE